MTLYDCNMEYQDYFVQLPLEYGKSVTVIQLLSQVSDNLEVLRNTMQIRQQQFPFGSPENSYERVNMNYKYHVHLLNSWIVK
jgi:hypothetical protein